MNNIQDKAKIISENKEVIEALETLSKYGMGVLLVHAHDKDGNFTDLSPGVVAYEEDLKVSFRKEGPSDEKGYAPVAWRWNAEKGGGRNNNEMSGITVVRRNRLNIFRTTHFS